MDSSLVIDWSREALKMALLLGGPPLLAALAVGIVVGIVQTLTQMHEATVAQVPRQVVGPAGRPDRAALAGEPLDRLCLGVDRLDPGSSLNRRCELIIRPFIRLEHSKSKIN